jgi:hypothetical protein
MAKKQQKGKQKKQKKEKKRFFKKRKKKQTKRKKQHIPKAVREQCWLKTFGEVYNSKCFISWCENEINVFDFHVGHDQPESKGGTLSVDNLKPICARCNLSMSNNFTIKEWNKLNDKSSVKCCCFKLI